jgi:hypothetical protein
MRDTPRYYMWDVFQPLGSDDQHVSVYNQHVSVYIYIYMHIYIYAYVYIYMHMYIYYVCNLM